MTKIYSKARINSKCLFSELPLFCGSPKNSFMVGGVNEVNEYMHVSRAIRTVPIMSLNDALNLTSKRNNRCAL